MIKMLRSLLFDGCYYTWTFFLAVCGLPVLFLPRIFAVRLSRFWNYGNMWLMKHVLGLTYKIDGYLPKEPFILASKHESAWETLLFSVLLNDPAFVLKGSLLHVPLIGWYFRKTKMISVQRKGGKRNNNNFLALSRNAAQQNRSIVIFPEGTRTNPGASSTLKPGVWHLYKNLKMPVVTVALNSGRYWSRRVFFKQPGEVSVVIRSVTIGPDETKESFLKKVEKGIYAL